MEYRIWYLIHVSECQVICVDEKFASGDGGIHVKECLNIAALEVKVASGSGFRVLGRHGQRLGFTPCSEVSSWSI
jgi:hypothetical protein